MDPNHPLFEYIPHARKVLALPRLALTTVVSKDGQSVYASSDTLFRGAVFGRDSLQVAEDLMSSKPKLARNILLTISSLQGQVSNDTNEEEPGKIIHEYRNVTLAGKPIDERSLKIFHKLSSMWGGSDHELAYYGSVDSTPHYLRAIGAYCLLYGDSLLDQKVKRRDGETVPVRTVVSDAATWLQGKLAVSRSGLVEFQRRNPLGIANQVWKDSNEFYVHESGELANHEAPIASIEVQGLAYDGLLTAAKFHRDNGSEFETAAIALRDRTFELLWQEDRNYFALGLDYDTAANMRIIATKTANPASLLDTTIFDKLPIVDKQKYISAIASTIMSNDFLTNAGVRSRALSASHLVDHWDYHGSFVSWPKETYEIVKGLKRHSLFGLSRQLENRLLNIVLRAQDYPEFVYVDECGQIMTDVPTTHTHGKVITVNGTNTPERIQAWTVSAVMAIIADRLKAKLNQPGNSQLTSWQQVLETQIMAKIPHINRIINPLLLRLRYPAHKYKLVDKSNN